MALTSNNSSLSVLKIRIGLGLILLVVAVAVMYNFEAMNAHSRSTDNLFLIQSKPYSVDPIDYDYFAHHIVFSSVHSTLVSQYKVGTVTGILASSWSNENNFHTWTFRIRDNLNFEDGSPITPKVIALSLTRLAFLMKERKSEDGLLSMLEGFDKIQNASDIPTGIIFNDRTITFHFLKSAPHLLELISFGLYGIASPKDFDPISGEWKEKRETISSGFYRIDHWTRGELRLTLRENFLPQVRNPNALKTVQFVTSVNASEDLDLAEGSDDYTSFKKRFAFSGGADTRIIYARCERVNDPKSPCHDKSKRLALRDEYYAALIDTGTEPTSSFFPLVISGVKEPSKIPVSGSIRLDGSITTNFFPDLQLVDPRDLRVMHDKAIDALEKRLNLKIDKIDPAAVHPLPLLDIRLKMTGIRTDYPYHDVRFMFLSKEGIKLPDPTGAIRNILNQRSVDLQKINEILWQDGLIWPIKHVTYGIWYNSSKYDFSQLNPSLPPLELQWIGLKD